MLQLLKNRQVEPKCNGITEYFEYRAMKQDPECEQPRLQPNFLKAKLSVVSWKDGNAKE
jgi:hypothetical protein